MVALDWLQKQSGGDEDEAVGHGCAIRRSDERREEGVSFIEEPGVLL